MEFTCKSEHDLEVVATYVITLYKSLDSSDHETKCTVTVNLPTRKMSKILYSFIFQEEQKEKIKNTDGKKITLVVKIPK